MVPQRRVFRPAALLSLLAVLLPMLLLSGCGDLPRPFAGDPGEAGRTLVQPPPARLAVVTSPASHLSAADGAVLAHAIAEALQAREVPAVAEPPRQGDWRLVIGADSPPAAEGMVAASFAEQNPQGEEKDRITAAPVPAAAWSAGDAATLRAVAQQAAPGIARMLAGVEAARKKADPNSLVNRPARVFFTGVHGAPGDGDTSLAREMRRQLPGLGPDLTENAANADFTLDCQVRLTPLPGAQSGVQSSGRLQQIEVAWRVVDARGREAGKATQIKEIPAGSLDSFWGDVAVVAVQEAAAGVQDIILNYAGARRGASPEGASPEGASPENASPEAASPEAPASLPVPPVPPAGKAAAPSLPRTPPGAPGRQP